VSLAPLLHFPRQGAPGTFVSLYSGAGGLDLGFFKAGFVPVWANDVDEDAVETYNGTFQQLGVSHAAVAGDIQDQTLPERHSADLVVGGPPCQGFSVAGKMDPSDPRSRHVWEFLSVVERIDPQAFVMENVMGLALNKRWEHLRCSLIAKAEELGYETTLLTLSAADFGVPQNRRRMFLIGIKGGGSVEPTPVTADARPTVREALTTLPHYGTPGNDTLCTARVTPAKNPVLRRSPFAGMLFNGQGRPLNLDAPAPTLPATMGGNRTPIIDQEQLENGGDAWVVEYHRRLWSGGQPRKRIPKRLRRLTLEEAAEIQTFPREMQWAGKLSSQFKQIGNAVPPELGYHVALAVRDALSLEDLDAASAIESAVA
jgi:DNA (cytosine-5)-methyltransferase 1